MRDFLLSVLLALLAFLFVLLAGISCYLGGQSHQYEQDRATLGEYADWCRAQGGMLSRVPERDNLTFCSYTIKLNGGRGR